MPGRDSAQAAGFHGSGYYANDCIKSQPMTTRSQPDAVDASEQRKGVRTLRIRITDKHAMSLSELAREVNLVWNFVNDLSMKVFQRECRFMSGYDLQKYTNGASKEGLRLHSQTIQGMAAE